MSKCAHLLRIFINIIVITFVRSQLPSNSTNLTLTFTTRPFLSVESNEFWPLTVKKELTFKFRTKEANGLLMYHTLANAPVGFPVYEFYLKLEDGRLKIMHEFGGGVSGEELYYVGRNLNQDEWHEVVLEIDPPNAWLRVSIDDKINLTTILQSLIDKPMYWNQSNESPAILYFGGSDFNTRIIHKQYKTKRFIGCIANITSKYDNEVRYGKIINYWGLTYPCVNQCLVNNLCKHKVPCINHYTHSTCDCFGTNYEGPYCSSRSEASQTFRGYSYISYKVYEWQNRVQSAVNRISLHFRTKFRNSVLFYGYGIYPKKNYFSLLLFNGSVIFDIDFGGQRLNASLGNHKLADNRWHNVTVMHEYSNVTFIVDGNSVHLRGRSNNLTLYIDPNVYIAGFPNASFARLRESKLDKFHKFIGCLKFVYFNQNNILYDLQTGNPKASYYSLLKPEYGCKTVDTIPITFQTSDSHIIVNRHVLNYLNLSFEFKTEQRDAVLSSGTFKVEDQEEFHWILHLTEKKPRFSVVSKNKTVIWSVEQSSVKSGDEWQQMSVHVMPSGKVILLFRQRKKVEKDFPREVTKIGPILIGSLNVSVFDFTHFGQGIVGCIRDVWLNNQLIDVRDILSDEKLKYGKFSIDSCMLVNPCNNPTLCEHGGKCVLKPNAETECNCTNTGYTGKSCHFSLYKRTCEELYLSGYRKSGTYLIDIDRNGPFPPSYVECAMSDKIIETVVKNNLPIEMSVRKKGMSSFYVDLTYRDFSQQMLVALIGHSDRCEQTVTYHCKKAILGMSEYTWMKTAQGTTLNSIGSDLRGKCTCSITKSCVDVDKFCNCDSLKSTWEVDSGTFRSPENVGITRVYVIQPNATSDSEGRLSIGPVKCIDSYTQKFVITFKTKESYLKVPGWKKGDLAFSFRTLASEAIILYQSALHPHHGYFKIILVSDYLMHFEYTVNGNARTTKLFSRRKLNNGNWQRVWIEYDAHHMRFTVNLDFLMIDLEYDEEFGVFEGPLYIGGAPQAVSLSDKVKHGFIGCLKGVVIADKILDLNRHYSKKSLEVIPGCATSCDSQPCQNGGKCVEKWGSYTCECANPVAHKGKNCDINYNDNAITFRSSNSSIHVFAEESNFTAILEKNLVISFRTHEENALIFSFNDYNNNFIQLHTERGKEVHLMFNNGNEIVSIFVIIGKQLTKGGLIQVNVDRHSNWTVLNVSNRTTNITKGIKLLKKYQTFQKLTENYVKPLHRLPHSYSQLFVGGVDFTTAITTLSGFVGCIAGFVVDGKPFDLKSMVSNKSDNNVTVNGLITSDCQALCELHPCSNNGLCSEDWRNNRTLCECKNTSFGGAKCDEDIGVILNNGSTVSYRFSSSNVSQINSVNIRFAFSSDIEAFKKEETKKKRALLVISFENSPNHILVALLTNGEILFEEQTGSQIYSTSQKIMVDPWRHWIVYSRKQANATLRIDNEVVPVHGFSTKGKKWNNRRSVVIIGNKLEGNNKFKQYDKFIGCISNLHITFDNKTFRPLVSMFSGNNLNQISVEGTIKQSKCGPFMPNSMFDIFWNPSHGEETNWKPNPPTLVSYVDKRFLKSEQNGRLNSLYALIACVTFLLIVFTSVGIYMIKLQREYKLKKFRGDTPFFHSKRSQTTQVKFAKSHMVNDDSQAAVRLLRFHPQVKNSKAELQSVEETDDDFDSIS